MDTAMGGPRQAQGLVGAPHGPTAPHSGTRPSIRPFPPRGWPDRRGPGSVERPTAAAEPVGAVVGRLLGPLDGGSATFSTRWAAVSAAFSTSWMAWPSRAVVFCDRRPTRRDAFDVGPAGPPRQRRPALGVGRGQHQPAEHGRRSSGSRCAGWSAARARTPPRTGDRPGWSGTSEAARAMADSRGSLPRASIEAAPTWTAPLSRTSVIGSSGRWSSWAIGSATFSAWAPWIAAA